MADFDPNRLDGKIAIAFVVISFVLLLIVIATCTICWCWRYKLHKRKAELKAKELEQGLIPTKKSSGCCRCCGCWMYCCRCCLGCCDDNPKPVYSDAVVVVQPVDPVLPTGGCSGGAGKDNFGWSRDVYVYNTGGPGTGGGGGCGGGCGSPVVSGGGRGGCGCSGGGAQPVNFNGRWSVPADAGRLVLGAGGGGGLASHVIPGASPYGGIVPSTTNLYTKVQRKRY